MAQLVNRSHGIFTLAAILGPDTLTGVTHSKKADSALCAQGQVPALPSLA